MRITRLIAGTVTAGLLGITPLAVAAPSNATENLTTTTTLEIPYVKPGTAAMYGDDIRITASVKDSTGGSVYDGTVTLFQMTAANPGGVPVATAEASGYVSFPEIKASENSTFKAVYSGYAATSAYEDNLAASEAVPVALPVSRKVTIGKAKARLTIKGKVAPKYAKKKVKIQIKKGKKYKPFKTIKTNKKSKFQVRLPAKRGGKLYFKIVIPGNSQFVDYSEVWYTYSYRPQVTPRVAPLG